ncbi:putative gustatory receptor 77a [Bactrocera tryoni]|uniref:putative gustatory receptor 77a n=1 Tax=Bactrocera tryoni TaxID=59916 RepID=UPI001A98236E|nr:putative gustatory receptor 77a [Bactrocera tryoni]
MLRLQRSISRIASQLRSNAGHIPPRPQYDRYTAFMLCCKLIPLLLSPTWTIFIVRIEHVLQRPAYLVALLILYYCQLALQLTLSTYFVNTLMLAQQSKKVNALLRTVLQQAAKYSLHSRPFNTRCRYQFHTLVYIIKRLRSAHEANSQISGSMTRLYGPQLVAFLGFVLTECTVQFFVLYFTSCSQHAAFPFRPAPQSRGEFCYIRWNIWAMVYVFGLLSDMSLVVSAAHQLQSRVQATRVVLAEGSARLPLLQAMCRHCSDVQLARTLADFALYLRMDNQQQPKIGRRYVSVMICGLFAMERRLIFVILQTILNYLLILIQYDKVT